MEFNEMTKEAILQRMLNFSPDDLDKQQGSVTYDLLSPLAMELAQAYVALDRVLQLGFADTSYGEYLDRRCEELGVFRKSAEHSHGQVTFVGPENTEIEVGTIVSTTTGIEFTITQAGTLIMPLIDEYGNSGTLFTVTLPATAKEAGVVGNVIANTINVVRDDNLKNSVNVNNEASFVGGVPKESDKEYLDRYLETVRQPATSGNKYDYMKWAKEISGISDAQIIPHWDGQLGTVKVIVLGDDKTPPSDKKVDDVKAYIEEVRPVGAEVTVEKAVAIPMNVSVKLELREQPKQEDKESVKQVLNEKINQLITGYLASLAFVDPMVRHSRIANLIGDVQEVKDYHDLEVNDGIKNIEIGHGEVAVMGILTLELI
ncbi:baseplate J/gp47 family protein [Chengkuizengella sp. SCS-71B]|uniref:baseplate J/gp47 family protein n=1 Tax=Chengkuizengella sp. SCS-71B TaxID=3115290 RepID=UPI0032C247C2